jgi:hypothetical protein
MRKDLLNHRNRRREKFAESPVAEKALTGAAAGKFLKSG